jgi:hypothetical protein
MVRRLKTGILIAVVSLEREVKSTSRLFGIGQCFLGSRKEPPALATNSTSQKLQWKNSVPFVIRDSPQVYILLSATRLYAIRRSDASFVTASFVFAWG